MLRRSAVASAVRWTAFAALSAMLGAYAIRRGPIGLDVPATVLSNSHPFQKATEPYLVFLQAVRRTLPEGATVTVARADLPTYLVAVGQLPRNRVLLPASLSGPETEIPRFVASHGTELTDPRYRLVRAFGIGLLYEVRR